MHRILFVEDDQHIRAALKLALEDEGYEIIEAVDGLTGLTTFDTGPVDLVLLDLRLPDISGFEVCRLLRAKSLVPIIIVTAQSDTHDLVAGLEAGADDYVTKPVVAKELAARIRASLRRTTRLATIVSPSDRSVVGDIELRSHQGIVLKNGNELPLTKTEYRLLQIFFENQNNVLSRDQLLELVWGYEYLGDSRLVDAHIRRLRVKIEDSPDDPKIIVTVRGMGYRLLIA